MNNHIKKSDPCKNTELSIKTFTVNVVSVFKVKAACVGVKCSVFGLKGSQVREKTVMFPD